MDTEIETETETVKHKEGRKHVKGDQVTFNKSFKTR